MGHHQVRLLVVHTAGDTAGDTAGHTVLHHLMHTVEGTAGHTVLHHLMRTAEDTAVDMAVPPPRLAHRLDRANMVRLRIMLVMVHQINGRPDLFREDQPVKA